MLQQVKDEIFPRMINDYHSAIQKCKNIFEIRQCTVANCQKIIDLAEPDQYDVVLIPRPKVEESKEHPPSNLTIMNSTDNCKAYPLKFSFELTGPASAIMKYFPNL